MRIMSVCYSARFTAAISIAAGLVFVGTGCDSSPSGNTNSSSTNSAATSAPSSLKEEAKAAPAPTLQAPLPALIDTDEAASQPAAKKITLPDLDISNAPTPVRTKYSELRRAMESSKDPLDLALTIASIHYVHGNAADAAKIGEQVVAARPTVAPIQHMLGLFFEKAGNADKALAAYQKVTEIDPTFQAAYVRIGIISLEKDAARALASFKKASELLPDDARPYLGMAKALKEQGKNEEAYKMVQEAISRFPTYAEAHRDGAALCKLLGKTAEAAKHEEKSSLGGLPPNPDYLMSQILLYGLDLRTIVQTAMALAQQGKPQDAETMLMTAIPLDTHGTMARRAMANVKTIGGKYDEAASMLQSIVDSDAKDAAAVFQLGDVLAKQGKLPEAIERLKKAAELAPQDPRVVYMLGLANLRVGKLDDAKAAWETALRIAPLYEDAYGGLVQVAVQQKNWAEAIRILRSALEKVPDSAVLTNGLAWYLATHPDDKLRNGAEAVTLAEKSVKATEEKTHEFLDTLACAYAEVGRFDDAKATCAKAIKLAGEGKNDALLTQYKERLALFEQKKPYRDEQKK